MAENPSVIIIFLKNSNSGRPDFPEGLGFRAPNLLIAAKNKNARLHRKVNFDKKESIFIL